METKIYKAYSLLAKIKKQIDKAFAKEYGEEEMVLLLDDISKAIENQVPSKYLLFEKL